METIKVLTSLLVLMLTGPSLGYPYNTRGLMSRDNGGRSRGQYVDSGSLSDYLSEYVQGPQYGVPEYQPTYRQEYDTEPRQRINAEALAALLPYLTSNNDDYAYDYSTYSDDDGTWYDDAANENMNNVADNDDAALMRFLMHQRNGRYSLEDLETLEREAQMEDNSENQLHALMAKKMSKKSSMPLLGAIATPFARRTGQKEEALEIPSMPIRQPVYGREIVVETDETDRHNKRDQVAPIMSSNTGVVSRIEENNNNNNNNNGNSQEASSDDVDRAPPVASSVDSASSTASVAAAPSSSSSSSSSSSPSSSSSSSSTSTSADSNSETAAQADMTPFIKSKYETLMKYLERERKVRQNQDIEQELRQETKSRPQKRFVSEQDALSQQLTNLKKKVA